MSDAARDAIMAINVEKCRAAFQAAINLAMEAGLEVSVEVTPYASHHHPGKGAVIAATCRRIVLPRPIEPRQP